MPELEIQAVRRIYDAFSQWNVDELTKDITHDFELMLPETVPWGGTHHGPDGVEAFTTIFRDHVEGQWADPDDFIDGDDVIVVLGRQRGRAKATGERYEVHFAAAWSLSTACRRGVAATSTRRRSWPRSARPPSP